MNRIITALFLLTTSLMACAQGEFSLGADISWATEMESKGQKLYNYKGEERDAFTLMKEAGLNAIRLRVWVDPKEHGNWCGKEDVLAKAKRAKALGMDIMIDFHYSDWWADPAKQNIPAAWAKHKYKALLTDVANHTREVLTLLKDNAISVKWVQVGNETSDGMMWPVGKLSENPKQYAGLFKAGYDAVKEVYPEAQVIVHLDKGDRESLYNHNLDALRDNGAKWDIIGMSLYPYWSREYEPSAKRLMAGCIKNINNLVKKYHTPCMIVETGFQVDEKEPWVMMEGKEQLKDLITLCKTETKGNCLGVFYWEPTCKPTGYKLGAFGSDGRPTEIMRGFTNCVQNTKLNILPEARKGIVYDRPLIQIETTMGNITIELYNETPQHRDMYLRWARKAALDSVLIHRVISNFMIQMGDPASKHADATLSNDPAEPLGGTDLKDDDGKDLFIPAEIRMPQFFHKRGAIAAAREDDAKNPTFKSSSSQFYIVWGKWPTARRAGSDIDPLPYYLDEQNAGVPYLDGTYTVFGEVIEGLDIVEKIQKVRTDPFDRPVDDIRVLKFRVLQD